MPPVPLASMAIMMFLPSGLNPAEPTGPALAAGTTVNCWPVTVLNTGAVPFPQATMISSPVALNDAVLGEGHALIGRSTGRSSQADQTVTIPLADAVTNLVPLVLNSRSLIGGAGLPRIRIRFPVAADHSSTWPL